MHELGNKVICPKCGKIYRRSEYLFEHLYKNHNQVESPRWLIWKRPNGQLLKRACKRVRNAATPKEEECKASCSKRKANQTNSEEQPMPSTSSQAGQDQAFMNFNVKTEGNLDDILSRQEVKQAEHNGQPLIDILEEASTELLNWDNLNPTYPDTTINWEDYLL